MRYLRLFSVLTFIGAPFLTTSSTAQDSAITPRVTGAVTDSSLVAMKGNVPGMARVEYDRGEAPAATQLTHIRLVLARSAAQQAALDKYDAELQDKSSPNYHKWLTPEQFGRLYGPADSDIAAIVAWLQSHGLTPEPVSPGRTNIAFSGTVQQVEEALHTSIHTYEANGQRFFSNATNPSIPTALAEVVAGVAHLNTIEPRPHHVGGKLGMFDPGAGRLVPSTATSGPTAELAPGSGSFLYIVAADAATMYDSPNSVLNPLYTGTPGYSGTGVTIGIGGDAAIQAGTAVNYRGKFIGDAKQPIITNVDNVGANGDTDEAYIDVELAGALAPGATVHFYTATSLGAAIDKMIADNTVDIFSLSFGYCELMLTTADNLQINTWWQNAETQGIAVTVSTGDSGSAGCDNGVATASYGLQVSGWGSTPHNIAVGGTDTDGLISNFSTYANSTNSNLYRSTKSYIPESTWNDSVQKDGLLSANRAYVDKTTGKTNIVGATGGASSCSTNTSTVVGNALVTGTCTSGYAKPSWQRGAGVPGDKVRDVPDVSLMAGNGMDSAAWAVCTDEQSKNSSNVMVTANCSTQSDGLWYLDGFGGTSTSAPAFAGILALMQQKTGGRLGQAAKEIYDLYNGSHASAIFHDVTIGNISVPCSTGTPNCGTNSFLTGYDATAGYDLATGIGSVDIAQLINYWGTATGAGATTMMVTPSLTTLQVSQGLTVAVMVSGTQGTPTGTVTLTGGGYTSSAYALSSGNYMFTIAAGAFAKGSDTLTVTYSGDVTYASSIQFATVTVNGLTATVSIDTSASTMNSNAPLTVSGAVAGSGATPTGTVTVTGGGYTSPAQTLSAGSYSIVIPANSLTSGADVLTATYSGDNTYNTAQNTASVSVGQSTFTLTATNVTLTAGAGSGNVSTVTVTPVAGYTGTVALTALITPSPTGVVVSAPTLTGSSVIITNGSAQTGTVSISTTAAAASVPVAHNQRAGWLRAAGGTAIAALLCFFLPLASRHRKYLCMLLMIATSSFAVIGCGGGGGGSTATPAKSTPTVTVTPAKTSILTTDTLSVAVAVSGSGSTPTGSVTLASGSYSSAATSLSAGTATITIPASSLAVGSADTLTATYGGDSNFNSVSGTASVTVKQPGTTPGTYTVSVTGKDATTGITATTTFTLTVN